jgi:flagellar protein FlgJ
MRGRVGAATRPFPPRDAASHLRSSAPIRVPLPMNPLDPNRLLSQTAQSLAADGRSLDGLRRAAARDPKAALKGAAQQFEAVFMQMVLKSMRDAVPKSGLLDSPAHDTYTALLDQQLAARIAGRGTGLAALIEKQLASYVSAAAAPQSRAAPAVETPAAGGTAVPAAAPTAGSEARSTVDEQRTTDKGALRNFALKHWDHAAAAERATGVPARFILAQAALESGWGKHEIRDANGLPSYNLFGIKAGAGWTGRTVEVVTTEYENGTAKKVVEKFRAYGNYGEAFRDWARLIKSNPRYAPVLVQHDARGFAAGLQRAGYATDPAYANKLARTIEAMSALRLG